MTATSPPPLPRDSKRSRTGAHKVGAEPRPSMADRVAVRVDGVEVPVVPPEHRWLSPVQAAAEGLTTMSAFAAHLGYTPWAVVRWRHIHADFPEFRAKLQGQGAPLLFSVQELGEWYVAARRTGRIQRPR